MNIGRALKMPIETKRDFVARWFAKRDDMSLPVTFTASFIPGQRFAISSRVILEARIPAGLLNYDERGNPATLDIEGRTEDGNGIMLYRFRISEETHYSQDSRKAWSGTAELMLVGDLDEFDSSGGQISTSAIILPTPLATATPGYNYLPTPDGTIPLDGNQVRAGIIWKTPEGDVELIDYYDFRQDRVGFDYALVRIQRCQVTKHEQVRGKVSLTSKAIELLELDEPLVLLSFLSRKRNGWYEARIHYYPPDGSSDRVRSVQAYRSIWIGYSDDSDSKHSLLRLLVNRNALLGGGFQALWDAYQNASYKDALHRAILHILMSHERGYIEIQLAGLYSAVEGILGALNTKSSRKLPLYQRLEALARQSKLDLTKLWPPQADITQELQQLAARRNQYMHTSKTDDYSKVFYDFYRLQAMIELWILKLLGYPDSEINEHGITHEVVINRQEFLNSQSSKQTRGLN
jgi:hypothetical protein